jgi:hypothetical protein
MKWYSSLRTLHRKYFLLHDLIELDLCHLPVPLAKLVTSRCPKSLNIYYFHTSYLFTYDLLFALYESGSSQIASSCLRLKACKL